MSNRPKLLPMVDARPIFYEHGGEIPGRFVTGISADAAGKCCSLRENNSQVLEPDNPFIYIHGA